MNIGKTKVFERKEGENFRNPKIPKGYIHLKGTWDTGFVIQNQADKSEFVWIPVGWLDNDATLDGVNFNEKFGRIKFSCYTDFSKKGHHEDVDEEAVRSVNLYGGYYFARYFATKENEHIVFKKASSCQDFDYYDAEAIALDYAKNSEDVISRITSGAAFDTLLRWIMKSNAKTYADIVKDSSSWGNYWDSKISTRTIVPPGSREEWSVLNIYDVAGNIAEWTSEMHDTSCRILRGGEYDRTGAFLPVASRVRCHPQYSKLHKSFRVALYLK